MSASVSAENPATVPMDTGTDVAPGPTKSASGTSAGSLEEPFFPETYPAKLCVLCNLGERSQLGQGEMLKVGVNDEPMDIPDQKSSLPTTPQTEANSSFEDAESAIVLSHKRQKYGNKHKHAALTTEYVDELEKIGHVEQLELKALLDDGFYYVHRACASWSFDVKRNADATYTGLQSAIAKSLARKCSFCNRHGASLHCKMTCANAYHLPCMTASGGFQMIQSFTCFCRDHLGEVPNACPHADEIKCRTCACPGDLSNLMLCSKCGDHYHGSCVGIAQAPGVRAGWQCVRCRQCHICRSDLSQGSADARTVSCEHCDKIYHTQCVRPPMATIPKYGWKCRCCRLCVDCGARSPGAGASSRWHQHYTVCDSCYQQRNKGFSCPVCNRAYRALAQREMVKCGMCQRHVHATCDPDAEPATYQARKEAKEDYEYMCTVCKLQVQSGRFVPSVMRRINSIDEEGLSTLQDSLYLDQGDSGDTSSADKLLLKLKSDFGLGKGKPLLATKSAKKKFGLSLSRAKGKFGVQKRSRLDLGRKRGTKAKMRGIFGVPGLGLQRPTSDKESAKKEDEEPGVENRLVLCSAKDKFVLTQDICVMCGAIGTDCEGCLISCSQCGQCYHPYCVSVKVTKVILQKGWRCLDCTVCEGCGQRHDEARLLLCDDCDVSYHIYCMDPPLDIVPQGNWKCRWCAICQKCGTNDPGFNCAWMNSYTECGPCASQSSCSVCAEGYGEGELIIQCTQCDRWLHGPCDAVITEEDAEKCFDEGYACAQCRPRDALPAHLKPKLVKQESQSSASLSRHKSPDELDSMAVFNFSLEGSHYVDGVCLSQHGLQQIKSQQLDSVRKKRRPKNQEPAEKDAGILAAIESVVAGSSVENSLEDIKMEPLDPKEEAEIYKDGMIWERDSSTPPEGFTLFTTEQGTVVLRKKRQRNLQKVGIGGFTVRNRTMKSLKETLVKDELDELGQVPQITAGLEDKKKKVMKKKPKNKLSETYPSYLQEAFFGKELLDTKAKYEPSSSDDESKDCKENLLATSGGAVGNKLSAEELKMIESIRAKQQLMEQKKFAAAKPNAIGGQPGGGGGGIPQSAPMVLQQPQQQQQQQVPGGIQQSPNAMNRPGQLNPHPSQLMLGGGGSVADGQNKILIPNATSTAALTPQPTIKTEVLSTGGMDANFTDILDTIINDDNDLLEGMDDIINGVFTDESQESQESVSMQSSGPFQPSQLPKPPMAPQGLQPQQQMAQQQQLGLGPQNLGPVGPGPVPQNLMGVPQMVHGQQQQRPQMGPQQPSVMQPHQMMMGPQQQQFGQQQRPQTLIGLPQQQQQMMGGPMMTGPGQQQQQVVAMPQTPTMGYPNSHYNYKYHGYSMNSSHYGERPDFTSGIQDPMANMAPGGVQGQWGNALASPMEPDMGMIGDDSMPQATQSVSQTNNQKASERMRLDEMLGEMATSAPVLYANTHHPELKIEFPKWADRHKQIIKRWRGLSVDIKTPFNQKARENRTTLRMKKTQQVAAQSPKDVLSAPSPSSLSQSSSQSSSISIVTTQQPPMQQQQQQINIPQSPQQQQAQQQHLLASPIHNMQQANNIHGGLSSMQAKADSQSVMTVANNGGGAVVHNQQQQQQQMVQGGNYMLDMQQQQQQNMNEMMIVGGGGTTPQLQQQQVVHMQSPQQPPQPQFPQKAMPQHQMEVLGQVKKASDSRLSPLSLHKDHDVVVLPSNTGISSPREERREEQRIAFAQRSFVVSPPSSMAVGTALSFSPTTTTITTTTTPLINHNQSTLNHNLTTTTSATKPTTTASNNNNLSSSVKATLLSNNNQNPIPLDGDADLVVDRDECAAGHSSSPAPRTSSLRTPSGSGNISASAPVNSPAMGPSSLNSNVMNRRVLTEDSRPDQQQQHLLNDEAVELAHQHGPVHYQSAPSGTKDASPPPSLEESISSSSALCSSVLVNSNQGAARRSMIKLGGSEEQEQAADHLAKTSLASTANMTNALMSMASLSQGNAAPGNEIRVAFHQAAEAANAPPTNMNIVVSHPISQFMKNLTIGTSSSPRQPGIILPQTQFTIQQHHQPHATSQFLIHPHPPPAYHPLLHPGLAGPAPNVTVNPNGNFQTNPNATIRATYTPFRAFGSPLHAINNFGRLAGPLQTQLQQQGIQSPILAAQLQTINQIATAQMQSQQQFMHIQSGGGGGSLEHAKKSVLPIFVSTTLHQPVNATNSVQNVQKGGSAKDPLVALKAAAAATSNEGHSSPLSSSTASPMSASSSSPSLTKAACSIESSTPSPQSSSSSMVRSMTPQPQDQNIRVLTPSEIMRTLPSIPNQDAMGLCGELVSAHSHDSRSSRSSDSGTDQVDSGPRFKFHHQHAPHASIIGNESALIVAATTGMPELNVYPPLQDQEKMTAQQKSLRDQENERQWKLLQAARAREQQLQQQLVIQGTGTDPNQPTTPDPSAMGMQSPTGFVPPSSKGRPGNFPQPGMVRPVSVQIPRPGQNLQRMGQNPFSPQSQSSQSPMEQFPNSPAQSMMDMVTHSPSDHSQDPMIQSPHTPRSFDMQSPNSAMSRSPAYSGGSNMQMGSNPYAMPPGTPRPNPTTNQSRPTVYARDMFGGHFSFQQDQYNNNPQQQPLQQQGPQQQQPSNPNMPQSPQHDGNRQLRDLLQRQQLVSPNSPSIGNTPQSPNWNQIDPSAENQNQVGHQQQQQLQQPQQMMMPGGMPGDNNTFRLPLPPVAVTRPQRMQMMMPNAMRGPNPQVMAPRTGQMELRQRMMRPKNVQGMQQQQQVMIGQQPGNQFNALRMQGGMLINSGGGGMPQQMQHVQQQQHGPNQQGQIMAPGVARSEQQEVAIIAEKLESIQHNMGSSGVPEQQQQQQAAPVASGGDQGENQEIPDNVTADLETLEQEVCGEDLFDEAFLGSLSGDFNILEYADPELDTMNDEDKSNLLDSLELDEPESGAADKEEKAKKDRENELNAFIGSDVASGSELPQMGVGNQQQQQQQMPLPTHVVANQPFDNNAGGDNQQAQQMVVQQQQRQPQGVVGQPPPGQQQHFQNQQQMQQQQRIYQMKQPIQLPPNIQQIQQHMINQIQQSAAMGKPIPPGTQFSSNGVIGTVTSNNQIQFSYSGVVRPQSQQRMQQMRMANPNGQQQLNQMGQPRMIMQQQQQQPINQGVRMQMPPTQDPNGNQVQSGQQQSLQGQAPPNQMGQPQQQQQQQGPQGAQPPPPPYPIPPPPYPGNAAGPGPSHNQEQPLLLEDLLEQEKREQERQNMGPQMPITGDMNPQQQQQMGQMYQRAQSMDGGGGFQQAGQQQGPMGLPMAGAAGQQPQSAPVPNQPQMMGQPRPQIRGANQTQWRMPNVAAPLAQQAVDGRREVPVFPLQAAPPTPPENLVTDQDRQMHMAYDQWLNQQNSVLGDQLKYFETEVGKLRKAKKILNTKQRQAKKAGGELSEADAAELAKVSNEQSIIQKQLESARKQARQHNVLLQEYRAKRNIPNPSSISASSPANAPQSPLMSPSPGAPQMLQQQQQQPVQSPLNNPMIQAAQSPLHSPSPMMTQSPGSASLHSILQSPNNQGNAMSPYNTMQSSPRIGTPHSQGMEENPFSPSGVGPSPSPSLTGRLTSPSPRMTSPQHRPQFPGGRILASPGGVQFQQQQQANMTNQQMVINLGGAGQGQARFARPQMMQAMQQDGGIRQRIIINTNQQQQQQQQQHMMKPQQQPPQQQSQQQIFIGSPMHQEQQQQQMLQQQSPQMGQMGQQGQQIQLGPQRALIQQRQQILQHQMMAQQGQVQGQMGPGQQQQQQYQKQSPIQSPIHQPQSPMLNQMAPSSPIHTQQQSPVQYGNVQGGQMIRVQQQQQQQQMNVMDNNQRNIYLQQQQMQHVQQDAIDGHQQQNMGGGGGIIGPHNPIPLPPSFAKHGYIKLGLFGGSPIFTFGRGDKRLPSNAAGGAPQSGGATEAGDSLPAKETAAPMAAAAASATTTTKVTIVKRVKSVEQVKSNEFNNEQRTAGQQQQRAGNPKGDIVIIDSSPDDKQRIMDYDDDNDKAVMQEVSLSEAAQSDDVAMMETFSGAEFVASPLEPEVTEEYVLFGQEYEEFVESDDDIKGLKNAMKPELELIPAQSGGGSSAANVEKSPKAEFISISEIADKADATVIGGPVKVMASGEPGPANVVSLTVASVLPPASNSATLLNANRGENPKVTYAVRLPLTSSSTMTRPATTASVVAHNKLVKDVTQTTAIVSIGNTTISVPLLKTVPMSHNSKGGLDQQSATIQNKKIVMKTPINLTKLNLKSKLVSLSPVTLSNAGNAQGKRVVQASLIRASTPQPPQSQASQAVTVVASSAGGASAPQKTESIVTASFVGATPNVLEKLSTKIKSPSLSYSKLSSLTVNQNALPDKIFQDDVSPDSSVEHDDTEMLSPAEKVEFSADGSDNERPTTTKLEGKAEAEERKSTIPFHVIVKTKDTNNALSVPQTTTQRLMSVMPQLSPLSQPSEMNTNMQNASQQLRTIMSSLNPTASQQVKLETGTVVATTGGGGQQKGSSSGEPSLSSEAGGVEKIALTMSQTIQKLQKAGNVQLINKTTGMNASKLTQILSAQPPGSGSPSSGNILVVKQVRPGGQPGQRSAIGAVKQHMIRTIKTDGGQQQATGQSVIITQQGVPNLTKIQQNLQKEGSKAILQFTQFNNIQPPALVISSRPATVSAAATAANSLTASTSTSTATVTVVAADGASTATKPVTVAATPPPPPFTGSILSATLSKPSLKLTQAGSSNTLLHTQLTSPPFRRSKSTDEAPLFLRESPAPIPGTKRLSLELSNIKPEPSDAVDGDSGTVSSSTPHSPGGGGSTAASSSVAVSGCKSSTVTSSAPKSEDSQHVLLKQLLQNSNSPSIPASAPPVAIASRAVPGLRAPSLGLVSSLEQQLSRPAIPPVPANTSQLLNSTPSTSAGPQVSTSPIYMSSSGTPITASPDTPKPQERVMAKETSFLSKPRAEPTHPNNEPPQPFEVKAEQQPQQPEKVVVTNVTTVTNAAVLTTATTTAVAAAGPASTVSTNIVKTLLGEPQKMPSEPPPPYHLAAMNTVPPPNVVIKKEMSTLPPEAAQMQQQQQQKLDMQKILGLHSMGVQQQQQPQQPPHPHAFAMAQQQHLQNQLAQPPPQSPQSQPQGVQQFKQLLVSPPPTIQNPLMSPLLSQNSQNSMDIKKELIDDSSQQSAASDQSKSESSKTEFMDTSAEGGCLDAAAMKAQLESAADMKKRKRREYQKNRRQMQANPKETTYGKKKQKRLPKFEEDYDTFIDNMMVQLRQLPSQQILEPELCRSFGICNPFGAGDLSKLNSVKNYNVALGDLAGDYGSAELESDCDFYNTQPFGVAKAVKKNVSTKSSTHYGFYDQEFSQLCFDVEDDQKSRYEMASRDRDINTPDTVISSSSPECMSYERVFYDFPGLKLIDEHDEDEKQSLVYRAMSPPVPLVAPIPIRLKAFSSGDDGRLSRVLDANNKENEFALATADKPKYGGNSAAGKDQDNMTVTLTLSSSAAEDIIGVLRDLANILHIPPPTQYDIVERTATPPNQRFGLYRVKGRDGKETATIDIQTILNGAAKFCRHCNVVILNSMIRAKASEFPSLNNAENDGQKADLFDPFRQPDDVYFCSKVCHKQFQCRPSSALGDQDDKVAEETAGDAASDADVEGNEIRKSMDLDLNDEDLKMEVDLDESELKEVAGGIDLKDLVEIKSEMGDDELDDDCDDFPLMEKQSRKCEIESDVEAEPPKKLHKGLRYKFYQPNCFSASPVKYRKPTDKEITETLFRMSITVNAGPRIPEDTRKCIFCHQTGDGVADGPSRLLNFDVDKWVHLNCALWSEGVYETVNGALMNLEAALQSSLTQTCIICNQMGATIKCFKPRCTNLYHLGCAMKDQGVFYKNKTTMCVSHAPKTEKDNELTTLSVQRRVYVERDESRQVASVMHHSELSNLLRVGSLIFLNVGQLLPHQLVAFHTPNYIYPIGYKIIRFYWSMREPNKRCRYICSIADVAGHPEFRVLVQEPNKDDLELRDSSPRAVWQKILEPLAEMRRDNKVIQLFPKYVTGEDLFGLTEPAVVRILESLPGIETLADYRFKYGRNPLLELPLAINPSGAARTEPKLKQNMAWKKPHTQRTGGHTSQRPIFVPTSSIAGEVACPYSKQFVHSKSSQYKKMKQEWRNNVFLARSKIQGLGLYAARDLEKHTMVIEYIGEVIRTEVSEFREKQYEAKNRGIYMFRLDEDRVVDATLSGGLARYINHSCNPNCVTEIVEVDREFRIIIFAKRRINRGEELSYDYKFDIEDDNHKISCMCGAPNCKKWMN